MDSDSRKMLASAVIEQAVIDARSAYQEGVIDDEFRILKNQAPLPDRMQPRDIHSLASFFNQNLESFVDTLGIAIEPDVIRHGTRKNISKPFKRICHESAIQDYERRWKVNPITSRPDRVARRKGQGPRKRSRPRPH